MRPCTFWCDEHATGIAATFSSWRSFLKYLKVSEAAWERAVAFAEQVECCIFKAHTVKQWSIGRPYEIAATGRNSSERGVPKLFSSDDALRFAVPAQLTRDGFMSRVIKAALNRLNTQARTLAITSGRARSWNLLPFDVVGRAELGKKISTYILDLARLRDELARKIMQERGIKNERL